MWVQIAQSVVQLTTGWTVRGSNPSGGRDFPHPSRPALGLTRPPIKWVPCLFPGVKRPGCGLDHPPHLAPRLKKEYRYSSSGPWWPILMWSLPLPAVNNNNERFPVAWFSLLMKHVWQKTCARKTHDEMTIHLKMCESADVTSSYTLSAKRKWVKLGSKAEIHKTANRARGFLATRYS